MGDPFIRDFALCFDAILRLHSKGRAPAHFSGRDPDHPQCWSVHECIPSPQPCSFPDLIHRTSFHRRGRSRSVPCCLDAPGGGNSGTDISCIRRCPSTDKQHRRSGCLPMLVPCVVKCCVYLIRRIPDSAFHRAAPALRWEFFSFSTIDILSFVVFFLLSVYMRQTADVTIICFLYSRCSFDCNTVQQVTFHYPTLTI